MATGFVFLWFSLFSLLSSALSDAKITPRFPSSLINRAEQLSVSSKNELYRTEYFTQVLDHFNFNPESYQTFQQRYLINDTYWGGTDKNAPIFVYTGNEGHIDWFAQNTGFMFENAPHFKALLVFIEHRFYGESMPFGGDKEVAYSNKSTLGYLSSTQALADYATLIIDLKKNLTAIDSPVVVFGGSYGGMLAAWFRLKYPHVAVGALASSSPILYFEDITSSYSFNDIVTQDFKRNYINAEYLKSWLKTAYIYTAMTDYPTPSNFLNPLPAYPVKQMCEAIDDPKTGNDTFTKLYAAANIYYNYTGTATCFDLVDNSDPHGLEGWTWQACTEMILPTGGNNEESIFPVSQWNYSSRASYCNYTFQVEPRPNWITSEFGGHNIKRVLKRFGSNIIFFNGKRDPWSGGGVLKSISKSIVAIVAPQGAHHVDLRFSTTKDPQWLKDVRKKEINIIAKWISQYYHDLAHLSS